jgi:hypothetical protein
MHAEDRQFYKFVAFVSGSDGGVYCCDVDWAVNNKGRSAGHAQGRLALL